MSRYWRLCVVVATVGMLALGLAHAAEDAGPNLLANGGLEQWQTDHLPPAGPNVPALLDGLPTGWSVSQEAYERGDDPAFVVRGAVSRETALKVAGEASVRLTNAANTDITEGSQGPFAVQPDAVYRVRCLSGTQARIANIRYFCSAHATAASVRRLPRSFRAPASRRSSSTTARKSGQSSHLAVSSEAPGALLPASRASRDMPRSSATTSRSW